MISTGTYITKISFPAFTNQTLRVLGDVQRTHEAISRVACPVNDGGGVGRLLWRKDSQHSGIVVYVVSPSVPDENLVRDELGGKALTREYAIPSPLVERGARVGFKLTANPGVNVRTDGGVKRRVVHRTPERQLQWLSQIGDRYGFQPDPTVEVSPVDGENTVPLNRVRDKGGNIPLVRAGFTGTLTVTDTDSFVHALTTGVGKARAFGCGLLTLSK